MLVRNPNGAVAVDHEGTEYVWAAGEDVLVPDDFANEICAIPDAGFIATQDAERDDSDDLITVNEARHAEGEPPIDGGDKVLRPKNRKQRRAEAAVITEVDPEGTEPESAPVVVDEGPEDPTGHEVVEPPAGFSEVV